MEYRITFNSRDPEIRSFLVELGLSKSLIQKGAVTESELAGAGLDPEVFRVLALEDVVQDGRIVNDHFLKMAHLGEGYDYVPADLSVSDVRLARALLNGPKGDSYRDLFTIGAFPDGMSAKMIYENRRGHDSQYKTFARFGATPETKQELARFLEEGFTVEELSGIVFASPTTNDQLVPAGKAVLPIFAGSVYQDAGQGAPAQSSAVIVSPLGHIVTADHVVFNDNQLAMPLQIVFDDVVYTVSEVLYADPYYDLAILHVPELADEHNLPYLPFASAPPKPGEVVTAIGFPMMQEESLDGYGPQTIAIGHLINSQLTSTSRNLQMSALVIPDEEHVYHETSVRLIEGNSGGAFLNSAGELIGVASIMDRDRMMSYATSVIPDQAQEERLHAVLAEIATLQ